jgi:hypothetical protein
MSGGCLKQNPVQVAAESALIPSALHKLNQAKLTQKVEMSLDGSSTAIQYSCQCLHLWPAETCFIVCVICKAAVRWNYLSWDTSCKEHCCFRYAGKFLLCRHVYEPFCSCGGSLCGKIAQRAAVVSGERDEARRFFYIKLRKKAY